jgi:dTMP kinase
MKGLFISFEGVDGCGKSTQMRFLAAYLEELGYELLQTREPGGCQIAEKIREILLDVDHGEMCDNTEALLYAAARAQHVAEVIRPAIGSGRIVLCDRFIDSSLAYQGVGRGFGIDKILDINAFAIDGVMPDKTFFLDFPPRLAFQRMNKKRVHDRLEKQDEAFHIKLYDGFVSMAERWPERMIRIDASGEKNATRDIIRRHMDDILRGAGALARRHV